MNTLDFEKDLADKLAEVGAQLRQVREAKSISIEQVAATTLIRARLLRAIEDAKLEHLPEPIYIQGCIRRFGDALGLNGTELASTFPAKQVIQPIKSDWKELPTAQLRPVHLYLLYIVLVVVAVSGLSYFINRSVIRRETTPASSGQPLVPGSPQAAGQSPTPSQALASPSPTAVSILHPPVAVNPSTTATPTPGRGTARVSVTLKVKSWLQIKVDGKTEFEGELPAGTQRNWTANQKIIVQAGNAGGVLVSFNDAPAKALGELGAVETVTFEPKPNPAAPQPSVTPSAETQGL